MDKVVKILEQYVQWITLALAGVWVSWQAYSYIVKEPLTTTVGMPAVEVTPKTVDDKINDGSANKLRQAMANTTIDPPKSAKVLELLTRGVSEADVTPVEMASLGGGAAHARLGLGGDAPLAQEKVKDVPNLPAAMPDKITSRWTVIDVPAAGAPAAAPAAAVADPAAPAAAPAMVRQDVAYSSITFKVDSAQLSKEFNRCYSLTSVPPNLLLSEFVRVELLREEKKADGTWSTPTVIPTLPIYTIMPHPGEQKPPLAAEKLKPALYDYKAWFEQNQDIIIHPAFFQTAPDAEIWVPPGEAPPAVVAQPGQAVAQRPFDPSRDIPKTPEQIAAKQQYDAAMRAARAARSRGPGVRPGGGPPVGGVPGAYVPPSDYRPFPNSPGGGPPTSGIVHPGRPTYPGINPGMAPPLINPAGVPQPAFNPNAGLPNADVQILVHDISIREGKTYRYTVRYKMFNPMWDHKESAVDWVAAKFDIDSPDATNADSITKAQKVDPKLDAEKLWTPEITVEQRAHIYVTKISPFNYQAEFVVYTWKDGHWKETPVKKMMPGDPVTVDKAPTAWTVVDVRKDTHTGQAYVILMDDHGILQRRDEASDAQSPEWQKLKTEAGAAASAK